MPNLSSLSALGRTATLVLVVAREKENLPTLVWISGLPEVEFLTRSRFVWAVCWSVEEAGKVATVIDQEARGD